MTVFLHHSYLSAQTHKIVSVRRRLRDDLIPSLCDNNQETKAHKSQGNVPKVTQRRGGTRPQLLFLGPHPWDDSLS